MEGEEKVRAEAAEIISLFPVLPRLVVFDLDYTIWPYDWLVTILFYASKPVLFMVCKSFLERYVQAY
jgi:hypothetical protein